MSGEHRRFGGWFLPVIVVAIGAYFLITGMLNGTLHAVALRPVNWVGVGLMALGVVAAFFKKPLIKLAGVLICGVGAILIICL